MLHNWALRRAVSSGGGGPPSANQVAWFRKNTGIVGAGFCSQWTDQSGLNHHLLQATGANQPSIPGDGTLLFDGVIQFMKCAGFTLIQPETVYLRFKQVTWTSNDFVFDGDSTATGALAQRGSTPGLEIVAANSVANNTGVAVNTYASVACVFNGASSLIQVNNNAPTTGDIGAGNMGGFTLGAIGANILFANIQVAEVIIYNVAHNQATRDAIIAYLNTL